ncbi:RES family NAD+ phosphorylase [Pseudarthrobacter siccitolerans]|uniref:RES family NAD+ phosphorylase n=1 Tax=Pseudarthrobacter siccitolerans TaxID=861266 RepID=UPI0006788C93|nr:RES family NAD+ phosphorylase [Pseudarthrobacter siccitolerans]
MASRRCCANCFSDRLIREELIAQCDPVDQTCDYCGAENVSCVEPDRLGQWFSTLMATYEEVNEGKPIVQLLDEEWGFFRDSGLRPAEAKDLLADVLDDGELVRRLFVPIEHFGGGNLKRWEDLRDEMMHVNRWFLAEPMDMDRIKELLSQLIASPSTLSDLKWYRARLLGSDAPYEVHEMGAPPPRLAGHGRANPAGIPYLYLGSTRATSVAELRPHTGERACVAEFQLAKPDLKLADLRDPRSLISPLFGDESQMIKLRADLPLLERLGDELTRPVHPRGAPYEYIPTQYLCEFVKTCGFHGVMYRSSVSSDEGVNIALFDPRLATATHVEEVSVEQVSVQISPPSNAHI